MWRRSESENARPLCAWAGLLKYTPRMVRVQHWLGPAVARSRRPRPARDEGSWLACCAGTGTMCGHGACILTRLHHGSHEYTVDTAVLQRQVHVVIWHCAHKLFRVWLACTKRVQRDRPPRDVGDGAPGRGAEPPPCRRRPPSCRSSRGLWSSPSSHLKRLRGASYAARDLANAQL